MKKEETNENKHLRVTIISLIFVVILVLLVIVLSFSTYFHTEKAKIYNYNNTENVSMTYAESTNSISIANAFPISDEAGKTLKGKGEYFDFSVTTKVIKGNPVEYEIVAVKDNNSTLSDNEVKIYLEKQENGTYEQVLKPKEFKPLQEESNIGAPIGSMVLLKVKKTSSGNDNYRLRMWVSDQANIQEVKTYSIRINVYGKMAK